MNVLKLSVFVFAALASSAASSAPKLETAVLAGGCSWGVESVFEHVAGVRSVIAGFAGGTRPAFASPGAEPVGFAEAVRIQFDPAKVSYAQLLDIFFNVAHDPTQVDRQGPDVGPRYRSAIFPQTGAQRQIARSYLDRLRASGRFKKPLATHIESGGFDPAPSDQQDFVEKHPRIPYVVVNDLPKLAELKRRYPALWQS
jgi:peptide-methionine (S)-S-oxide reductase